MGRYLAIGITTNLSLQKKEAEDAFESLQNAIKYVEDNYAPLDIYDRTENEEYVMFKIKNKLLETELIDFLGDFYAARMSFNGRSGECDSLISTLKEAHTAEEIMSLAEKKSVACDYHGIANSFSLKEAVCQNSNTNAF